MSFNLLDDPLFPIVTLSGARRLVRFADLSDAGDDAPLDFDWPRPDLNIASYEFCIGVLAIAFQPDETAWHELWNLPPDRPRLVEYLAPLRPAFDLNGNGARFMQACEPFEGEEPGSIEALFIDTPGINGQKKNTDLLTHRDRYAALGLPAAAMALYALQQFAPSGGAGNRTSMRGGGPMTTLVMPGDRAGRPATLWRRIVANLPPVPEPIRLDADNLPRLFPWLAPTLLSDKASNERTVHPADKEVHPLHACFGMPRRIRLAFASDGRCDLTGQQGPVVTGYVQKPWGMNYGLWTHPLTPYRQQKEDSEPYSVKPKSGRFGYRDWVSVTFGTPEGKLARASLNLQAALNRAETLAGDPGTQSLRVAGWAMSNMEAITYLSAEQPIYFGADKLARDQIAAFARALSRAGDAGHDILRSAIRQALFSDGASVGDGGVFTDVRNAFYMQTEDMFHTLLARLATGEADLMALRQRWRAGMHNVAATIFESQAGDPTISMRNGERFGKAARSLALGFTGYGAAGKRLFDALELPPPAQKAKSAKEAV